MDELFFMVPECAGVLNHERVRGRPPWPREVGKIFRDNMTAITMTNKVLVMMMGKREGDGSLGHVEYPCCIAAPWRMRF
jgi:hypothetical protein